MDVDMEMGLSEFYLPKKRIAARFGRAADTYESEANVQMDILKRVAEMMKNGIGRRQLWCDFGSGPGMLQEFLRGSPLRGTQFVCLDLAFLFLHRARQSRRTDFAICGDIDFPPVRERAFDGGIACSVLQWVSSPEVALHNIANMLKPASRLFFSVFTDGSFAELFELRSRMGLASSVWLPTDDELLQTFNRVGLEVSPKEVEIFEQTQYFTDAISALGSMSSIGVTATGGKLLNRRELDELCRNYTLTYSKGGKIPLTYRAVIGKARKKG